MKTLNVMLSNLGGRVVPIGYEGENLYTRVRINCIEVFADYPDATVSMVVNSPVGQMYPAVIEKSGVMVIWDITDAVLSSNGSGECQLTFTDGDVLRKSVVFGISINRSLIASGDPPEPVQEWIDKAEETAQEIAENAANLAKEDIVESYGSIAPAIIETASGAIASFSDGADGMLVKTLTVDIDPVQDLHGQESPYPAGGGKNKLDNDAFKTFANWDEGLVSVGTYSTSVTYKGYDLTSLLTVGTQYTISFAFPSTGLPVYCALCSSDGTTSSRLKAFTVASSVENTSCTFTPESGKTYYIRSGTCTTEGDFNNTIKNIVSVQLELGSTATAYAPYENKCPISGWTSADVTGTGHNLWDEVWESGYISNGGSNADAEGFIRSKNYINVLPSTGYYFLIPGSFRVFYYKADKTFISYNGTYSSARALTTPSNCEYVRFYTNQSTYGNDISINYPSTDTQYHHGYVQQITYNFPEEAGTVYGGTLTIHQDGTGTLLAKRAEDDLGARDWTVSGDNISFLSSSRPSGDIVPSSQAQMPKVICDIYRPSPIIDQLDMSIAIATSGKFKIRDSRFAQPLDATAFKTAMNGVKAVYELAEPIVYELSEQEVIQLLKGVNNVWADCGDTAITYPADTKLYIDGKIAELQALILENISNS